MAPAGSFDRMAATLETARSVTVTWPSVMSDR
jgi:hypothetical protein